MKKFVYAIIFILIWFVLNLLFFFFNDSYKKLIIGLKYDDKTEISDEYNPEKDNENLDINKLNKEKIKTNFHEPEKNLDEIRMEDIEKQIKQTKIQDKINSKKISDSSWEQKPKTIWFSVKEQANIDFIQWIFKKYKIKKVKSDDELFYLTTEYPNWYLQYNGNHIILYFFENTDFDKNFEIFDALSYISSFKINKTDSFWEESFYINKIKKDWFVRLVIKYKNITFWLQVDKKYFNDIKTILLRKLR